MKQKISTFLLFLICLPAITFAQELKAKVDVNPDLLGIDARNQVSDIGRQIESYINNTRFTDLDLPNGPIPVNLNLTFRSGGNNNYSARLYVEGVRPVGEGEASDGGTVFFRGVENEWNFRYNQGAIPTFNVMRFDNLATVLDYYMILVVGLYADTQAELGGNQVFSKLRQLVSMGGSKQAPGFELISKPGEFTKNNLVSELTDPRFNDFRLYVYDYYYAGLDLMEENKKNAMLNLEDIIYDMKDFKQDKLSTQSVLMQLFFDSKAIELEAIFRDYEDGRMLDVLRQVDPSNGQQYNISR